MPLALLNAMAINNVGILSKADISELYKNGHKNLFVVGDISCDVNGSVEFLEKTTTIDKPFFLWNPISNEVSDEISGDGVAVMGVDILPTELSVESSKHFGDALVPLLKKMIMDGHTTSNDYQNLPAELANSCITQNGSLTPNFDYIRALMERAKVNVHHAIKDPHILFRINVSRLYSYLTLLVYELFYSNNVSRFLLPRHTS